MVEKLMTVRLRRVGATIGRLTDKDTESIDRALAFVLGFRD
jgi:hypothetical protein